MIRRRSKHSSFSVSPSVSPSLAVLCHTNALTPPSHLPLTSLPPSLSCFRSGLWAWCLLIFAWMNQKAGKKNRSQWRVTTAGRSVIPLSIMPLQASWMKVRPGPHIHTFQCRLDAQLLANLSPFRYQDSVTSFCTLHWLRWFILSKIANNRSPARPRNQLCQPLGHME